MIQTADFKKWFATLFAETFGVSNAPDAFFLDSGTSGLLGTIDGLSAAAASTARAPEHNTIASHCGHVLFLLQLFDAYERGEQPEADWAGSWATRVVDDAAWEALRSELRAAYETVMARIEPQESWPEPRVAAAMILLVHCAYHVGEVRQMLSSVLA